MTTGVGVKACCHTQYSILSALPYKKSTENGEDPTWIFINSTTVVHQNAPTGSEQCADLTKWSIFEKYDTATIVFVLLLT